MISPVAGLIEAVPVVSGVTKDTELGTKTPSLSLSLARTGIVMLVSSLVTAVSFTNNGAMLTGPPPPESSSSSGTIVGVDVGEGTGLGGAMVGTKVGVAATVGVGITTGVSVGARVGVGTGWVAVGWTVGCVVAVGGAGGADVAVLVGGGCCAVESLGADLRVGVKVAVGVGVAGSCTRILGPLLLLGASIYRAATSVAACAPKLGSKAAKLS